MARSPGSRSSTRTKTPPTRKTSTGRPRLSPFIMPFAAQEGPECHLTEDMPGETQTLRALCGGFRAHFLQRSASPSRFPACAGCAAKVAYRAHHGYYANQL